MSFMYFHEILCSGVGPDSYRAFLCFGHGYPLLDSNA